MKLRNKIFTIVLIVLVIIALIGIAIGYALIGADILAWLTSRWAIWIYTFTILFLIVWACIEVYDRIKRL
jgi:hypothetical protein